MKLFIPELGTILKLAKDWTFTLYAESRNIDLWITDAQKAEFKKKTDEIQEELEREINKEKAKNSGRGYMMTPAIEKLQDKYRNYRNFDMYGKGQPKEKPITLSKGSVLTVDRIYIRKGSSDFSSVTFKLHDGKRFRRFWARLEDVNKLEFDEVKKGLTFADKYPKGRFALQRNGNFGMYLSLTEPSGGMRSGYLGLKSRRDNTAIQIEPVQNNSFGLCNYYDSLEKMVAAAEKFNFPTKLIKGFVDRYNDPKFKNNTGNLQEFKPGDIACIREGGWNQTVKEYTGTVKTVETIKQGNRECVVLSFGEATISRKVGSGPQGEDKKHFFWAGQFINLNL